MPGVVDEEPLTGRVHLSHRRRQTALPAAVELTPSAVAVARWLGRPILLPRQLQRDAGASQLPVNRRPVRLHLVADPGPRAAGRREQDRLQPRLGERRRQRPGQPCRGEPRQAQLHRAARHADRYRDRASRSTALVVQPQHLAHASHRHSLGRHRSPSRPDETKTAHLPSNRATPPPQGWPRSNRNGRHRIGISGRHQIGTGGRLAPEYATG